MKNFLKYLPCATTLAIMVAIFMFSGQNAQTSTQSSNSLISLIIDMLPDFLFKQSKEVLIHAASHFVRKAAHFTIYATLGVSVYWMFLSLMGKAKTSLLIFISVLFCFLYACSDEIHQMFVPGRSCQPSDILIDTTGAFVGIYLIFLFFKILRRQKR